ncbi:PQQ-dependent sugar dehydrogenase [Fontimonas sp. SYSU GA230001]|uniref:PQQ-dependent sugar dehydrogenase n=1 Tax=Fontimonas sp. SYSU GA230001 TaxID=3142450 RepID=UPI0032B3AAA4
MRALTSLILLALASACGAKPSASAATVDARAIEVVEVARGLENPWGLAFLPDGRLLVTERPGRMRIVSADGALSAPLANVPTVYARGQGGLLDVVLAPDFAASRRIYFCYAEPRADKNGTAVAHARLGEAALESVTVIFRQRPDWDSSHHFGCRLAFDRDGLLYVTLGERASARELAQDPGTHLGKVIRIRADGSVPDDNPFVQRSGARPEVWSYGHRNPQGAAIHPQTGELWIHEHGPRGGDEINIARRGRNYGWPVITHGREYSGLAVGDGLTEAPGMEQPLYWWVPSIAPSGMAFYTAGRFPAWRGSLFVGSLKFGQLVRLELDDERVLREERLLGERKQRIRDVRQGPDGYLYLLTDEADGAILRVGLSASPSP